jgi:hypothetical protein
MTVDTAYESKLKRQVNRKSIADLDVLSQAMRIKGMIERCGDTNRQLKVLELVQSSLST